MVDFTTACEYLRKAESELIALIGQTEDFDEREQLLGFAKDVRALSDRIGSDTSTQRGLDAGGVTTARPTPYTTYKNEHKPSPRQKAPSRNPSTYDEVQLPTFYSNMNALYRISRLKDGGLYEKHVPIENLAIIVQLICELLHSLGFVSTATVIKAAEEVGVQVREYHVQIALQALVFANALVTHRRGTYKTTESVRPDVNPFMDALISLPDLYSLSGRV